MKRLVKFHQTYGIRDNDLSLSSTMDAKEFKVYPGLYPDDSNHNDLVQAINALGHDTIGQLFEPKHQRTNQVSQAFKINEMKELNNHHGDEKKVTNYIMAFINVESLDDSYFASIEPQDSLGNELTEKQFQAILSNQSFGIQDVGEYIDGTNIIVLESWSYWQALPLAGYSLESFEKLAGTDETGFYDDTLRCDDCGVYDSRNNGLTYNHRMLGECNQYGINCGCYENNLPDYLDDFINNADNAIELTEEVELKLEFLERFIGGMVDGRDGYYDGQTVREGQPEAILDEYLAKDPEGEFIFVHDESGQFQTYFSIYKVKGGITMLITTKEPIKIELEFPDYRDDYCLVLVDGILIVPNDHDLYTLFQGGHTAADLYKFSASLQSLDLDLLDFVWINDYLTSRIEREG